MRIINLIDGFIAGAVVAYLAYRIGYSRGVVRGFVDGLERGFARGLFTGQLMAAPTMRWFGKDWGAPVCRDAEQAPVPIGVDCLFCPHQVRPGDNGLLIPDEKGIEHPAHLTCFMCSIGLNEPPRYEEDYQSIDRLARSKEEGHQE